MRHEAGTYTRLGTMTNPSKFLFNTDFAEPEEPEVVEPPKPEIPMMPVADHKAQLQKAKAQAFEEGRVQALKDLQTKQETLLTEEVGHLVAAVGRVLETIDDSVANQEKDAVGLAFLVARRLCAHLIARQPLAETVALVSECLGPLRRAPHLVIRVAERDVEVLKAKVDPIIHEKGFEGRLVILGEPEIARGDCHIEWADGGIRRDRKALEAEIDGSIRAYLKAGRTPKPAPKADGASEKDTEA
ncbi:flagellar assembly protein H [Roseibium alexandrii]|uniref:Flagellar assembly protein FliH n=2 Tax=Roseibium alexandrii TaxID=388408 RepID=A0A0M7ALE6_9HYPH|nr:flagellar assembly protein H [Roseibium alexandrii]